MMAKLWGSSIKNMPVYTPIEGVQVYPESILTGHGHAMLRNFFEQLKTYFYIKDG